MSNSEELVDAISDPKIDPSSDPKVATYTNNRKIPRKLLKNRFVPKIIQGAIRTIEQLVTEDVPGTQETLGVRQTVLPKEIVTDAARSGAHIFWTPREVSRTERDGSMQRDVNTAVATTRLTLQSPIFNSNSDSPTWTGTQDIVSPRRSIIPQEARNADPLDASINQFTAKHGHPKPIFSKVIGPKKTPDEIADVYARKRMDFGSNSVVVKTLNFMDFRLSPACTTDKLKYVIGPTTRVERSTNGSDWLASRHDIEEVTVERVSEAKT